ncbi:type II secretion system protein GspL [Marinicellulosiphila megalodicopiae]|uniref:type II secretion system protein GspL n=1 Tax=Marinicellulosiphila megalodicopiae TaxID=2724896 RepID=UPI003BAE2D1F
MSSHLYIRAIDDEQIQWLLIDHGSRQAIEQGDLGQLQNYLNAQGVHEVSATYFLNTQLVSVLKANIPSSQTSNLNRILPIALEEEIAQNVEDCEFKALHKPQNGSVWTCVFNPTLVAQIVEAFADIQVNVIHVNLDAQFTGSENLNSISITIDENRVLLKQDNQLIALPFEQLTFAITQLDPNADEDQSKEIELFYSNQDDRISLIKAQLEASGHSNINLHVIQPSLLEQMSDNYISAKRRLNLLNTATTNDALFARIKIISTFLAASLIAVICLVTLNYIQANNTQLKIDALWQANSKMIEQVAPELKNKKNRVVRQLKNELANYDEIEAPNTKVSTLNPITDISTLKARHAFSITEMRYSEKSQDWIFTLSARNDSILEQIRVGMSNNGYDAIYTSQKNESGKVLGVLKVSAK